MQAEEYKKSRLRKHLVTDVASLKRKNLRLLRKQS